MSECLFPPSAEVHSYKKVIYDRVDDADVKVTATGAIAQMYIRKQGIFTEKKIYPYAKKEDLRLDLLPKVRIMAQNHAGGNHPWTAMDDTELLKSAGLYGRDIVTGEEGYNLAAIMLLGKDDVILNVAPAYVTDALVRKVNVDRYDDREFLSGYVAKFVIEKNRMYVENANRATGEGNITVDNLEPNPKNPIIASFFRNIGYADQLGSGVRNLFKYSKFYSGQEPEFAEGDVFRIVVPLDDAYSFDFHQTVSETDETKSETNQQEQISKWNLTEEERSIVLLMRDEPTITQKRLHEKSGIPMGTIKRILPRLQRKGVISRFGNNRSGKWMINQ